MMNNVLIQPLAVSEFVKGLIILNLLLFPVTALITLFVAIMGASNPQQPGFLSSLGITAGFIYGTPLGVLVWLIALGKVFDFILRLVPITMPAVSWIGIILAAIVFVIAANIFIDHLYQFKQDNYSISFFALLITVLYAVIVYFSAKIPIPWIPK